MRNKCEKCLHTVITLENMIDHNTVKPVDNDHLIE